MIDYADDREINLRAIERCDPCTRDIIDSAKQVALYTYNAGPRGWERSDIEGSLFLYTRSAAPVYGMIILNRLSINNHVQPITPDMDIQNCNPYVLYKNSEGRVFSYWFYDQNDCIRMAEVISRLVTGQRLSSANQPSLPVLEGGPTLAEILNGQSNSATVPIKQQKSFPNGGHNSGDILSLLNKAAQNYGCAASAPNGGGEFMFSAPNQQPQNASANVKAPRKIVKGAAKNNNINNGFGALNNNMLQPVVTQPVLQVAQQSYANDSALSSSYEENGHPIVKPTPIRLPSRNRSTEGIVSCSTESQRRSVADSPDIIPDVTKLFQCLEKRFNESNRPTCAAPDVPPSVPSAPWSDAFEPSGPFPDAGHSAAFQAAPDNFLPNGATSAISGASVEPDSSEQGRVPEILKRLFSKPQGSNGDFESVPSVFGSSPNLHAVSYRASNFPAPQVSVSVGVIGSPRSAQKDPAIVSVDHVAPRGAAPSFSCGNGPSSITAPWNETISSASLPLVNLSSATSSHDEPRGKPEFTLSTTRSRSSCSSNDDDTSNVSSPNAPTGYGAGLTTGSAELLYETCANVAAPVSSVPLLLTPMDLLRSPAEVEQRLAMAEEASSGLSAGLLAGLITGFSPSSRNSNRNLSSSTISLAGSSHVGSLSTLSASQSQSSIADVELRMRQSSNADVVVPKPHASPSSISSVAASGSGLLNQEQLVQAFSWLLKHDTSFVAKLHDAYLKSVFDS